MASSSPWLALIRLKATSKSNIAPLNVAVIGAGWAGLAAAMAATQAGHNVSLFEASRSWGGRARSLNAVPPYPCLDNGQHILIGAYEKTLALMQTVGVRSEAVLWRLPLNLTHLQGHGLKLNRWPVPLNLLWGIGTAKGWNAHDKWRLICKAIEWQWTGFRCDKHASVAMLCQGITPTVWHDLIEPLCVSALNTPAQEASGQVFLRVLKDAVFGRKGSSDLLLPRKDLGALLPHATVQWLEAHGAQCNLGVRISKIERMNLSAQAGWKVNDAFFDKIIIATPAWDAAALIEPFNAAWSHTAAQIKHEAIATVYVQAPANFALPQPMLALSAGPEAPAQFVFDRGQICSAPATPGLLAFVVSAVKIDKALLELQVMRQAMDICQSISHAKMDLKIVQTVVEKRATFACTPNIIRPDPNPCEGLVVCGDYVDGPYPATLEGAVMSGLQAAQGLSPCLSR